MPTLLDRHAAVGIAVRLWRPLQVKLVQFDGSKRLLLHEFPDVSHQLALVAKELLGAVQPPLPLLNVGIVAETVLKNEKPTFWFQDTVHFR